LFAETIDASVDLVSVESLGEARRQIGTKHFDLVVLDLSLGAESGLDLLPDLYDVDHRKIPVIVFSARCADMTYHGQIEIALDKSRTSIDALLASVLDWLAMPTSQAIAVTA
jgi:DNA-binding response OmpR family regulator